MTATSSTEAPWAQKLALSRTTYPETGQAGYYKVTGTDTSTMNGTTAAGRLITAELSASTRAGIAQFTYPAGTPRPKVFLRTNMSAWSTASFNSEMSINPDTGLVTARALVGNFCRKGEQHNIYYALRFEQAWSSFGTWQGGTAAVTGRTQVSTNANTQTGGYFIFPDGTQVVRARMAISYTSVENAVLNLNAEMPNTRTFEDTRAANRAAWNTELGKVKVSAPVAGQTDDYLRTFYTALYHSITHPATFSDVNGQYIGFESTPVVHNVSEHPGAAGRTRVQYSMISDWDTYRSLTPFQAALWPEMASDQAQSLVNAAEQMGSFPNWTVANSSTNQMNGDDVAPLLAFTWEFGARDWDINTALDIMLENTIGEKAGKFTGGTNTGAGGTNGLPNVRWPMMERPGADYYNEYHYAPQLRPFQADHMVTGASYTQEYAIDDFSIAVMAEAIGRPEVAKQFYERAQWWQNLWNPTANGIQPRDYNGRYPESNPAVQYPQSFGYRGNCYDLGQQGFEEGNAEQYVWMIPHNLAGLITAMGGRAAAMERLDTFLSTGLVRGANADRPYMNLDNEPNFGVPWVYNYLGRPDKTAVLVDEMTQTLFGYQPAGSEPGNDDLGALANWYVWAALGMYPETSGESLVTMNTPMFDRAVISLGNGKTLTINAEGAQANRKYSEPAGRRYINSVKINGVETTKSWFDWAILNQDTTIDIGVSTTPNAWGTADADLPPSWQAGSRPVSLNVNTVGSGTFGAVELKTGATGGARVDVQRLGSQSATFDVAVTTSHPGIVAAKVPSQRFDSRGRGNAPLSFTVDPYLASGYYEATVTITSDGSSTSENAILKVTRPGSLESFKTVTGTALYDALKGAFDAGTGMTWSSLGTGTQMGANTDTNTYDREELAKVGLTPGAVKNFTADGVGLTVVWPTAPVGYPEAYQPAALQTVELERPTATFSLVGAAYTGTTSISARLRLTNGQAFTTVTYPVAFSNWVLPSTVGDVLTGTLAPLYDNSVLAWMPHRLAAETAADPGAYLFATKPYVAPDGWKVVSVTFPTAATGQRIFAVAGDAASFEVAATSAAAGEAVAVSGDGFAAGEPVTVALNTAPAASVVLTADDLGAIEGAITVPQAVRQTGAYQVSATAGSLPSAALEPRSLSVNTLHTYTPAVTVLASAVAGGQIVFQGTGFEPAETVVATVGPNRAEVTADETGSVAGSVLAPATAGSHTLTATGQLSGATATATATVTAPPPGPAATALGEAVANAEQLASNKSSFTAQSWAALAKAVADAKALLASGSVTEASAKAAAKAINTALAGLKHAPAKPVVTKVKLSQSQLRLVKGKSFSLRHGVYYQLQDAASLKSLHASYAGMSTWKSSNPKIASVSSSGVVKAKKSGTVTITVTSTQANASGKKLSASVKVKVVAKKPKSKVTKVTATVPKSMKVGQSVYLTGKYTSSKATGVKVSYSSSKRSVAEVDSVGRVLAKAKGTVKLTVKAAGKSRTYKITVK